MISSIFNSEYLRAWRELPNALHAWHGLLALGTVGICLVCNAALSAYHERTNTKVKPLTLVNDTQSIILGNSQYESLSNYDIVGNPQELGLPGTGYTIESEVFFAHSKRHPDLRLLMLGFCNVMLRMQDMQNRKGDYDDVLAWGVPWYKLPGISWESRLGVGVTLMPGFGALWSGPNLAYDPTTWNKAFALATAHAAREEPLQSLLPFTDFVHRGFLVAPGDGSGKMAAYLKSLSNSVQMPSNRAALLRMMAYCEKHGIDVALLRSPTTQSYWRARTKDWDEELSDLYEEIRKSYPKLRVMVWDAEHHLPMPDAWFYDGNHMHLAAHDEYVRYLNERISAWRSGGLPDDGIQSIMTRPAPYHFETTALLPATATAWEARNGAILADSLVPSKLNRFCSEAARVTLPPGADLFFEKQQTKLQTESLRGQAWFSSESGAAKPVKLELSVFDPTRPADRIKRLDIRLLRPEPELLSATATQGEEWGATACRIANKSDAPVTFVLAGPRLDLYRLSQSSGS